MLNLIKRHPVDSMQRALTLTSILQTLINFSLVHHVGLPVPRISRKSANIFNARRCATVRYYAVATWLSVCLAKSRSSTKRLSNGTNTNDFKWPWKSLLLFETFLTPIPREIQHILIITTIYLWWFNGETGSALDLRSTSCGFKSYSGQSCVTTLGKLFKPMCLCHQAV